MVASAEGEKENPPNNSSPTLPINASTIGTLIHQFPTKFKNYEKLENKLSRAHGFQCPWNLN